MLPHFRKSISQPAPKAMSTIDLRQTSRSSLGFNILKVIRPPLPQMGHIVPLTSQTMFRTRHEWGIWGAKCRSSDNNFLFIYLLISDGDQWRLYYPGCWQPTVIFALPQKVFSGEGALSQCVKALERDIHLDSGSCSQNAVTERVLWNALPSEHGLFSRAWLQGQ